MEYQKMGMDMARLLTMQATTKFVKGEGVEGNDSLSKSHIKKRRSPRKTQKVLVHKPKHRDRGLSSQGQLHKSLMDAEIKSQISKDSRFNVKHFERQRKRLAFDDQQSDDISVSVEPDSEQQKTSEIYAQRDSSQQTEPVFQTPNNQGQTHLIQQTHSSPEDAAEDINALTSHHLHGPRQANSGAQVSILSRKNKGPSHFKQQAFQENAKSSQKLKFERRDKQGQQDRNNARHLNQKQPILKSNNKVTQQKVENMSNLNVFDSLSKQTESGQLNVNNQSGEKDVKLKGKGMVEDKKKDKFKSSNQKSINRKNAGNRYQDKKKSILEERQMQATINEQKTQIKRENREFTQGKTEAAKEIGDWRKKKQFRKDIRNKSNQGQVKEENANLSKSYKISEDNAKQKQKELDEQELANRGDERNKNENAKQRLNNWIRKKGKGEDKQGQKEREKGDIVEEQKAKNESQQQKSQNFLEERRRLKQAKVKTIKGKVNIKEQSKEQKQKPIKEEIKKIEKTDKQIKNQSIIERLNSKIQNIERSIQMNQNEIKRKPKRFQRKLKSKESKESNQLKKQQKQKNSERQIQKEIKQNVLFDNNQSQGESERQETYTISINQKNIYDKYTCIPNKQIILAEQQKLFNKKQIPAQGKKEIISENTMEGKQSLIEAISEQKIIAEQKNPVKSQYNKIAVIQIPASTKTNSYQPSSIECKPQQRQKECQPIQNQDGNQKLIKKIRNTTQRQSQIQLNQNKEENSCLIQRTVDKQIAGERQGQFKQNKIGTNKVKDRMSPKDTTQKKVKGDEQAQQITEKKSKRLLPIIISKLHKQKLKYPWTQMNDHRIMENRKNNKYASYILKLLQSIHNNRSKSLILYFFGKCKKFFQVHQKMAQKKQIKINQLVVKAHKYLAISLHCLYTRKVQDILTSLKLKTFYLKKNEKCLNICIKRLVYRKLKAHFATLKHKYYHQYINLNCFLPKIITVYGKIKKNNLFYSFNKLFIFSYPIILSKKVTNKIIGSIGSSNIQQKSIQEQKIREYIEQIEKNQIQIDLNKQNISTQINRKKDQIKNKITFIQQQTLKIVDEFTQRKRYNGELRLKIDQFQIAENHQIEEDLTDIAQNTIKELMRIFMFVFRQENQVNIDDILTNFEFLEKKKISELVNEWRYIARRSALQQQIETYEPSKKETEEMNHLISSTKSAKNMLRSYIRERYLWQWIKVIANS